MNHRTKFRWWPTIMAMGLYLALIGVGLAPSDLATAEFWYYILGVTLFTTALGYGIREHGSPE